MKNENVKLKAILYFLVGLILNFLGLIIGGLWIKFKVKTNQKPKFAALITGFGIFLLFSYVISPYILVPQAEKSFYSKYPEARVVKEKVEAKYPDGKIGMSAIWNKSFGTGQDSTTKSTITVQYSTKRLLSGKEIQDMGKVVCAALQTTDKKYDQVSIVSVSVQSFLPINIPFANFRKTFYITATCDEWAKEDFSNVKSPI